MNLHGSKMLVALMALVVFFSSGCLDLLGDYEKIEGTGVVAESERDVKGFSGVHLATVGDMYVEFGANESFAIKAQENLHEYFEVYVKNDVLVVDTKDGYSIKTDKALNFYVTLKSLDYVRISSSGDVHAPDVKSDNFEVSISSSGDLEMGNLECSRLEIGISSSGDASIGDVNAERIDLNVSSSGDIELRDVAAPAVEARVSSSGDIHIERLESSKYTPAFRVPAISSSKVVAHPDRIYRFQAPAITKPQT